MTATNPATVLAALDAALNAHDPNAALALFADDAVVRYEPPPPSPAPALYRGKREIRGLIEQLITQHVRVQAEGYSATGERATSHRRAVYAAGHERLGGNPILLEAEALVRGSKIASLTFTFSPESLARMRAAGAAQGQQARQAGRE